MSVLDRGRGEGGDWDGTHSRVVQPEDVAVAVFEGRNQAFEVGHVVR